jgi:hypothetical protein
MIDWPWLIPLSAICALIGALIGGALGYAGARLIYDRVIRSVEVEVECAAARIVAPVTVELSLKVPNLAPISVPVEAEIVTPLGNVELTRRIIEEAPAIGPRALARIFQISTSTAQTYYVQSLKPARSDAPAEPPQADA